MKNAPNNLIHQVNQSAADASAEIDLSKILGVFWRGKLWIILAALLSALAGGYYVFAVAVPIYSANTTVVLDNNQGQIIDLNSVVPNLSSDQQSINTEIEVITSRILIEKVVEDLSLKDDPEFNATLRESSMFSQAYLTQLVRRALSIQAPPASKLSDRAILEQVIDAVLRKVSVSNVRQSYVFRIGAATQSAAKSARIANRLAELYILEQIEVKIEKTEQATVWLSTRVSDLRIELETAETELKEYVSNTDLISAETLFALNRQLKDLRDRQDDLMETSSLEAARLLELRSAKATASVNQMTNVAKDSQLSQLKSKITTDKPSPAFSARFEQILRRSELDKTRLDDRLGTITASIEEMTGNIATQSLELVNLQQKRREAEASRLIYEHFLAQLKETSVQQGVQQADSRILSNAVIPIRPSAPRKAVILSIFTIFGAGLGASLVLLRELSQTTFRVAEELEQITGYPVVGQIPLIPSRKRKKVLQYLRDKPNSAAAEAIRNLRTSLLLSSLDKPPKVILSTSSIPGEGKTTQSIAMAQSLSGLGKKVVLIEGDIRRRVFSDYFQITESASFLSVLLGEASLEEAVMTAPNLGFDIILGETTKSNAADIFSSEKFSTFIKDLRDSYDYVIIDTPPVLAVTDSRIIARNADAIMHTIKWNSTSHRQVVDSLKAFEHVNIRVSGLVLSQISVKGMKRYGYGDSYGAYTSYYE